MATINVSVLNHQTGIPDQAAAATPCAAGGDNFSNDGSIMAIFTNPTGASITLTEVYGVGGTVDVDRTLTARTQAVAAGKVAIRGPFPPGLFNDANNRMNFTYTAAGLTLLALKLGS